MEDFQMKAINLRVKKTKLFSVGVLCAFFMGATQMQGSWTSEDGDVDGSDLAVFAADFGRTDCL
jgi:hypothetical protein